MAFACHRRNPLRAGWFGALAFGALCMHGRAVRADETAGRTSSLSWVRLEGAESCIGTQDLAQAVEKRLKRKVFVSASEADVSVEGHVSHSQTPPTWRAVLTIRDAAGALLGTRELDSAEADCAALDEPLAFVVSVLIDPDAETRAAPEEPKPPPPAETPAPAPRVVVRRERVLVPVAVQPARPWRVEAALGGAVGAGLLPSTAFGVTTSVLVEPPSFWGILLTGTYWLAQSADAEQGATSDVSLAHGGIALCPLSWSSGALGYRLCGGVGLGTLQSQGDGFDTERSDEKLVAHAFLPNRVSLRIAGPLAMLASVSPSVPLARAELTYRAADGTSRTLFEQSPLAVSADLGLALLFD